MSIVILSNSLYTIECFGRAVSSRALHLLDEPAPLSAQFCSDLCRFRRGDTMKLTSSDCIFCYKSHQAEVSCDSDQN